MMVYHLWTHQSRGFESIKNTQSLNGTGKNMGLWQHFLLFGRFNSYISFIILHPTSSSGFPTALPLSKLPLHVPNFNQACLVGLHSNQCLANGVANRDPTWYDWAWLIKKNAKPPSSMTDQWQSLDVGRLVAQPSITHLLFLFFVAEKSLANNDHTCQENH